MNLNCYKNIHICTPFIQFKMSYRIQWLRAAYKARHQSTFMSIRNPKMPRYMESAWALVPREWWWHSVGKILPETWCSILFTLVMFCLEMRYRCLDKILRFLTQGFKHDPLYLQNVATDCFRELQLTYLKVMSKDIFHWRCWKPPVM